MKPLWIAFLFHFREQTRSKGFRITSVVISAVILGFFAYNHFMTKQEEVVISVVNTTSFDINVEEVEGAIEGGIVSLKRVEDVKEEQEKIKTQDVDHLLIIEEKESIPLVSYFYHRYPDTSVIFPFVTQLQQQYISSVTSKHSLSPEVTKELYTTIPVEKNMLAENTGSLGIVYVFIFLMYTFILMFGQGIAMNITGEKSTRVMEVMITKIKPIYMLFAKVLSNLCAGLIQVSIFFLAGYVAYLIGWLNVDQFSIFGFEFDLSQIDANLIFAFIFFFSCGYLVYALCFAALGSLISRTEDLGSVMGPVMILVIGALMVGMRTMMDPTGMLVSFSTYFPFFSPIVAFAKFVMGEITTIELVISGGILLTSILLIAYLSSRIYVKGVMVYGEKFKWSQLSELVKKEKVRQL
ncbi:ABC-2 type transport system permease protein [Bacillus mesophilus]|uniref:ABC transporter permease n=1 Tax=Bacillus mesophilus TaxID=1808955 RepID=A0A6M0Q7D2_9BACI|nr:ABC transporter permease [Bacillus mesophilus]MBM7661523.1 ABC-2 type transport system permease protein [Bacillus mesophilus]NEY72193.1 ABC transporter permease [Bacillus mesophilus]